MMRASLTYCLMVFMFLTMVFFSVAVEDSNMITNVPSTICNVTGPCIPCTAEQRKTEPLCKTTNFVQKIHCVQRVTKESKGQGDSVDNETVTSETKAEVTESPSETNVSDAEPEEKRKLLSNLRNLPFRGNSQKPLVNKFGFASKEETEPPPQEVNEYDSLQSCVLKEEESLSVLGFESIMAIILGVCGPVVYLRKKKSAASQGFNRVPSNPRF